MEIKHQTQSLEKGCGAACIAMVTGLSQEKVLQIYKHLAISAELNGICQEDLLSVLHYLYNTRESLGFIVQTIPYGMDWVAWDRRYILTVPSLNEKFALHYIVVDFKAPNSEHSENIYENVKIFDPQKGNKGKKYYENFHDVCKCFSQPVEILFAEL